MQDNIFNLYAFQYASKIGYIDKPLYYYNNQNINAYNKKYTSNIDFMSIIVLEETYNFLNNFDWFDDKDIQTAYDIKRVNLLLAILSKKNFNREYKVSINKRKSMVAELLNLEVFKDIYSGEHLKFHNKKTIVILQLLKLGKITEAYYIYSLRSSLKTINNLMNLQ